MAGQIPSTYRESGAGRFLPLAILLTMGILSIVWIGSCFRHTAPMSLRFWSVSFSPDGSSVVTGGGENPTIPPPPGELVFWEIASRHEHAIREPYCIQSLVWSSNGKFVAVGDCAGVTRLVSPESGKTLLSFSPPAHEVNAVAVSSTGNLVAAATCDGTIDLWDNTGKEEHLFLVPGEKFLDVAISANDLAMVASARSGKVFLFDLVDRGDPVKLQACDGAPNTDATTACAAFSPDGLTFATGALKTLRIWETRTGALEQDIACTANVNNIAFAPDGDTLATVHADGRLALRNSRTGEQLDSTQAHPDEALGLSFAPDGKRIATVSRNDFTIKIWNAKTLQLVASLHRRNPT